MTVVEGDQKAPFSIATTPMCKGALLLSMDCSTLPLIRTLMMLSVKQGGIKYHFLKVFMTRLGIEPQSPGPLVNTLATGPCEHHSTMRGFAASPFNFSLLLL